MKKIFAVLLFTIISSLLTLCQAQYTVLYNFNGTNGAKPMGSLLASGTNLYGMTSAGGLFGYGCIFCFNTSSQVYADLLDFNLTNGAYPQGTLIISGKKLFGMTEYGGAHNQGIIFSVDTDGSSYFDLVDLNNTSGYYPSGSLLLINSKLYGMTAMGGMFGNGLIFSIDTNASQWKSLYQFDITHGANPTGSLICSGDTLFGMTQSGGANNNGVIFSIDTDGSHFVVMHDFNIANDGAYPKGSLILSGNILFGMTQTGTLGDGSIFKIQTGNAGFYPIYEFPSGSLAEPNAELTVSGSRIYGMTPQGGNFNLEGIIFSIDKDSADIDTTLFMNLWDSYFLYDTIGVNPYGSITPLGGVLYGMTSMGGTNNEGVLFRIDTGDITSTVEINTVSAKINAYPNPGNGIFTFSIGNNKSSILNIEVYNVLGEKVYTGILSSNQPVNSINITGQPEGIYVFRIITENGVPIEEGKLVIQK